MRKMFAGLLLIATLLALQACGSGREQEKGSWERTDSPAAPSPATPSLPSETTAVKPSAGPKVGLLPWPEDDPGLPLRLRLAAHPDDAQSWLKLSKIQYQAGEYYAARVSAERALAAAPDNQEILRHYGWMCISDHADCNRYGRGFEVLQGLIARNPNDVSLQSSLAYGYENAGAKDKALTTYDALARLGDTRAPMAARLLREQTRNDIDGDGQNDSPAFRGKALFVQLSSGGEIPVNADVPSSFREVRLLDIGGTEPVLWVRGGDLNALYLWNSQARRFDELFQGNAERSAFDPLTRELILQTEVEPRLFEELRLTWGAGKIVTRTIMVEPLATGDRNPGPRTAEHLVRHLAQQPTEALFANSAGLEAFRTTMKRYTPPSTGAPASPSLQLLPSPGLDGLVLVALNQGKPVANWPVTLVNDQGWRLQDFIP